MSISFRRHLTCAAALLVAASGAATAAGASLPAPRNVPYPGTIRLQVDATDIDRHVFRVHEQIPVAAGPLVLFFPRFLPGTHGPRGEIEKLAGLRITAGSTTIAWQRDAIDPYAFHVEVPRGTAELDLAFDYLSPVSTESGRVIMTRDMLNVEWNDVVLYPAGHVSAAITVQASLRLPAGWTQASAMPVASASGQDVVFKPVSLETLVDSPAFAGRHVRRVELDPPGAARPIALNLFADEASQLEATDEQLQAHRNLVVQADRLFGPRHFGHYEFLLSLSERMGGVGLEHHQSSENGVRPRYFKDWAKRSDSRTLLPHEFTHSWNGKFRRPADLLTSSFEVPMQDSLLWVYEGQTQYWGRVLAARSGLVSPAQTRDDLAQAAAWVSARAGRQWRSLQDTTNEALLGGRRGKDWIDFQRSADYYDESAFIWLDADTLIREQSGDTKSLDDFARAFFGVQDGRIEPLPYTFDDLVKTLNAVWPSDWRTFLRTRLDAGGSDAAAPLAGLARAGWQLAWADTPSEFQRDRDDDDRRGDDFLYSIGLSVKKDGGVMMVMWDSPAFGAGVTLASKIVAVNGIAFKTARLSGAVTANKGGTAPIELLLRDGDVYRTVTIDYRGGLRYPRLERLSDSKDRLDAGILAARP